MKDKKYLKLEKRINQLVGKKSKVRFFYENCTPAMYDMHGAKSCERAEAKAKKHNAKSALKLEKYDLLIAEILLIMLKSGYSIEDIVIKYKLGRILENNAELSEILGNKDTKTKKA